MELLLLFCALPTLLLELTVQVVNLALLLVRLVPFVQEVRPYLLHVSPTPMGYLRILLLESTVPLEPPLLLLAMSNLETSVQVLHIL